jgi:hypothetical protein
MMTQNNKSLSEVLNALAMAMPVPDAGILEKFVRDYPQHADALTDYALELALELNGEAEDDEDLPASEALTPAASRAMSHLQNFTFELARKAGSNPPVVTDPFAAMSRERFRAFVSDLGVNTTFAMKLRDRSIEPQSIMVRKGFCQATADAAEVPMDAMIAYLQQGPSISREARFKAEGKPEAKQESFEEAVRSSDLSEEQQQKLLAL